jgi:Mn-dependent DtxR family transcriptional regulator
METWKEFENNEITHSAAHHLMAISNLLNKFGYARVTDVAKRLDITRGSASITLKALKERGLVVEDENKFLQLSPKGDSLARLVQSKRRILTKFFQDILQVDAENAVIDACKIEHLISYETGEKLLSFVKFLFSDINNAKEFLESFQRFQVECDDIGLCPICKGDCLLNEKVE